MTPLVDLGYAAYSGRSLSPHCNGFLGVPYAEPPLADLRFRNPRPISTTTKTTHVIDASQYPLFAVQGGQGTSPIQSMTRFSFSPDWEIQNNRS